MFYPKSKTVRKTSVYIVPRKRCDIQRERVFDLVESFSSNLIAKIIYLIAKASNP